MEFHTAAMRESKQIVDELLHAPGGIHDPGEVALAFRIELLASGFPQEFRKAADMPQGRMQVVGHGIGERFELLIGGVERGGALLNARLEMAVELKDLRVRRLKLSKRLLQLRIPFLELAHQRRVVLFKHVGLAGLRRRGRFGPTRIHPRFVQSLEDQRHGSRFKEVTVCAHRGGELAVSR